MNRYIEFLLAMAAATSARGADVPNVVPERDRAIQSQRPVDIILAQRELQATVEVGRVASSANGGGLIGAIIIAATDDKRQRLERAAQDQADSTIKPLHAALQGFDVDALALNATKAALARPAWFRLGAITSVTVATPGSASASPPQSATIIYRMEASPDFTQIRVIADLRLSKMQAVNQPALIYRQQISSIVVLREPSLEPSENVTKWSADDGKLAKAALTSAFASLERLIPFALNLSDGDVKAFAAKGREKAFAAGYYGPLIERNAERPDETLIWAKGLVNVQPSAN